MPTRNPPSEIQNPQPNNSWAWGIGLLYGSFALGMIGLVVFCSTKRVDLVRNDYYEAGVNHQKRIDAESRALSLAEQPVVARDANGSIIVTVPGAVASGTLRLYRADNPAKDFEVPLATDGPTTLPADQLLPGKWTLDLTWRAATGESYAKAISYHH